MEKYILKHFLGSGHTAEVYLAEHIAIKVPVAIKLIDKNALNEKQLIHARREIELLKTVKHENIIRFFDVIESEEKIAIILEYAVNGPLQLAMKKDENKNEVSIRKYFAQIVSAIDYLHNEKHIIHRDIKPQNILLDKKGRVKIADLGFSSFEESMTSTRCGSPGYTSPEMLQRKGYGPQTDIWSMGIVLYFMATGSLPFQDTSMQLMFKRIINEPVTFPNIDQLNPALVDLIKRMLEKDPKTRITLDEIKTHKWLKYNEMLPFLKMDVIRTNYDLIKRQVMVKLNTLGYSNDDISMNFQKGDREMCSLSKLLEWKYENASLTKTTSSRNVSTCPATGSLFVGLGQKVKCYRRRVNDPSDITSPPA